MELHQGETIALPPTGPLAAVAEGDDSSVLAALRKDTNVAEEAGPIPLQPRVPGGQVLAHLGKNDLALLRFTAWCDV
jgi:hypothetical protein